MSSRVFENGEPHHESREELKKKIEELGGWFQCFNLDGILTNPANPNYPEIRWRLIEPYVPEDLTGRTVLDLGCNAGYFAIKMKQRKADYVLAIDNSPVLRQAQFVSEYYGVSIDYKQVDVYEFVLKNQRKFDIVLFLGLFYHLRHPLLVLDRVAEIATEKLYFQTVIRGRSPVTTDNLLKHWKNRKLTVLDNYEGDEQKVFGHPDYPCMFFIEKKYNNDSTNWWFCNETGVYAVLRSAGFRNIIKSGSDVFICDPPEPEVLIARRKDPCFLGGVYCKKE
jgi:tRNA (mo5U34)-methyltransferase